MVQVGQIIPTVATAIEADNHISIKQLSAIYMMPFGMDSTHPRPKNSQNSGV
jgi:hypothetical protein